MNILFAPYKYLDFHTHRLCRKNETNIIEIVSLHFSEKKEHNYFTVGKHPWLTTSVLSLEEEKELIKLLTLKKCLAIGEIGIDKLKGVPMELQIKIFKNLLKIAEKIKKPVIIHCVRAFDKLIKIKREYPKIQKWCVHGFSRHSQLAKQLIHEGFYLSLMPVPEVTQKYIDLVKSLPIEKFFLETDSMPNTKIENIYLQVAKIKNISTDQLKKQIMQNATLFFR